MISCQSQLSIMLLKTPQGTFICSGKQCLAQQINTRKHRKKKGGGGTKNIYKIVLPNDLKAGLS